METNRKKIMRYESLKKSYLHFLKTDKELSPKQEMKLILEIARIETELAQMYSLPISVSELDSGSYHIQKPSKLNQNEIS